MKILFTCPTVEFKKGFLRPKIENIRQSAGMFPCSWSIGGNICSGVAEVTPKQLAAVLADPDIAVMTDGKSDYSAIQAREKSLLGKAIAEVGGKAPVPTDKVETVIDSITMKIDNKALSKLDQELANETAVKKLSSLGVVLVPAMAGLIVPDHLTRRQLMKAALAGAAAAYLVRPRRAESTVVFTDSFTVSSDTDLDAYPSGSPDYAYLGAGGFGAGSNLTVVAASDRVQTTDNFIVLARIIDPAGAITGDQKITAQMFSAATNEEPQLLVRCAAFNPVDCYLFNTSDDGGSQRVEMYRCTADTFSLIASSTRTFSFPATCSFQATGAGATVSLEVVAGGTSPFTFGDTDGDRKTSGPPGIAMRTSTLSAWIDDLSVDNLVTTAAGRHRPILIQ